MFAVTSFNVHRVAVALDCTCGLGDFALLNRVDFFFFAPATPSGLDLPSVATAVLDLGIGLVLDLVMGER